MDKPEPYSTHLDPRFAPLELVDLASVIKDVTDAWYNQTLCRVNDCLVRLGVAQGEAHWHRHEKQDEFFYVVEGHFIIELEDRTVELDPQQGFTVPMGVMHRPRAPQKTTFLIVQGAAVQPPAGK